MQQLLNILFGLAGTVIALLIVWVWKGLEFIKSSPIIWIVPVAIVIIASFLTSSPYFITGVMVAGGALLVFATINNKK